jgi:hypothetical protein
MSTPILIRDARFALIWTQAHAGDAPALLATRPRYQAAFDAARDRTGTWMLPWDSVPTTSAYFRQSHFFWKSYLERSDLAQVSWLNAWRHLLPLRAPSLGSLGMPHDWSAPAGVRLRRSLECFGYPSGAAVMVTIGLQAPGGLDLAALVDAVARIRLSRYPFTWQADQSTALLSLDDLAAQAMARGMDLLIPGANTAPPLLHDPWSIVAVIDGTGTDPDQPIAQGSDLHRVLEGLCLLHPRWRGGPRYDLAASLLNIKLTRLGVGDGVYATERGRAIWFPSYFSEHLYSNGRIHKVGHYHRNVALATMQTASLIDLIARVADSLRRFPHTALPGDEFDRGKHAAGVLGRLYGGAGTYGTPSTRRQIASFADTINQIRQGLLRWPALR